MNGGLFGGMTTQEMSDPRVAALKDLLEKRPPERDTHTTATRSAAILLMQALGREFKMDELDWLSVKMAGAWAGEAGWDRHTLVDALGRDRPQPVQQIGPQVG